jgi:hypothetical protein
MKLNSMKSFGGAILGLLLFLGITLVSSTTAQAQYPYQDQDYYRRQREYQRQQRERQRQLERQRQQAQQGGWYDQYGNYHPYNRGNYNQGYYNRGSNNEPFYRSPEDNYGYYGGSADFRQTALNAGYGAGIKAGREDRRSGRYDPYRHSDYRDASKDYNSRRGDRAAYQQYFREAFINGYADGYRGY